MLTQRSLTTETRPTSKVDTAMPSDAVGLVCKAAGEVVGGGARDHGHEVEVAVAVAVTVVVVVVAVVVAVVVVEVAAMT